MKLNIFSLQNIISIKTNAPQLIAPGDPRRLFIRMENFRFDGIDSKSLELYTSLSE